VRRRLQLTAVVVVVAVLGVVGAAVATGGRGIHEKLTGYQEQPLAISTTGSGKFDASFSRFGDKFSYKLSYHDLEGGPVTQAHIHFGEENQVGGVSVFLCTNLGNGPAGTQACPAAPATITGTVTPADVIGPMAQGIAPGEFDELMDALQAGVTYVNVHTVNYPVGEIRARIDPRGDRHHGD
jgi:CHRD domain